MVREFRVIVVRDSWSVIRDSWKPKRSAGTAAFRQSPFGVLSFRRRLEQGQQNRRGVAATFILNSTFWILNSLRPAFQQKTPSLKQTLSCPLVGRDRNALILWNKIISISWVGVHESRTMDHEFTCVGLPNKLRWELNPQGCGFGAVIKPIYKAMRVALYPPDEARRGSAFYQNLAWSGSRWL